VVPDLREDKHWSYGARTLLLDADGPRPFLVIAPVQSDKTAESAAEIVKELRQIGAERPVSADELKQAQDNRSTIEPALKQLGLGEIRGARRRRPAALTPPPRTAARLAGDPSAQAWTGCCSSCSSGTDSAGRRRKPERQRRLRERATKPLAVV
jgi:hypothetical protein